MNDLIKALTIFAKYESGDVINCDHDEFMVCIDPDSVSVEDKAELSKLSFRPSDEYFVSFRYGSC